MTSKITWNAIAGHLTNPLINGNKAFKAWNYCPAKTGLLVSSEIRLNLQKINKIILTWNSWTNSVIRNFSSGWVFLVLLTPNDIANNPVRNNTFNNYVDQNKSNINEIILGLPILNNTSYNHPHSYNQLDNSFDCMLPNNNILSSNLNIHRFFSRCTNSCWYISITRFS